MKIRDFFLGAGAIALSAIWLSGGAFAFCGKVQASASGATRNAAISIANAKGLQETRRLDSNYGGNVHYKPATVNCEERDTGVYCNITQKFCVDGAQTRPAIGEEGGLGAHGCPRGTRPVPETDNCVPVAEHNENNLGCKSWKSRCDRGDNRACGKYESNCQND
jgi:hypothetical protein